VSVLELHLRFGVARSPRAAELHVQRTVWEVDQEGRSRRREEHRAEVDLRALAVTSEQRERLLAGWWSSLEEPDPRVGSREWQGLLGHLLLVAGAPTGWFEGLRHGAERLRIVLDPVDRVVRQLPLERLAASIESADVPVARAPDVTLLRRNPPPFGAGVAGSHGSGATSAAWPGRRLAVGLLAQGEFAEAEVEAARDALTSWEKELPAPTVRCCEVVRVQPPAVRAQLEAVLRRGPELLVLWGHGDATGHGPGTWWTEGVRNPEGAVHAADLAEALELGRPEVLVLAMCDGATAGRHGGEQRADPSLAEAAAGAGVPIVLAFQGKVEVTAVNRFLAAIVAGLTETDDGLACLDLARWEDILAASSSALSTLDDPPSLVVHVASHLLTDRGATAPRPLRGTAAGPGAGRRVEREIHEAAAQLVVVAVSDVLTFRVPLPRKRAMGLSLSSDGDLLEVEGCRKLTQLPAVMQGWVTREAQRGVGAVEFVPGVASGTEPVLTEAAELVALVGALEEWRDESAPGAVVEMVAAQVDRDLSTWGPHPLAIEVGTGQVLRRFDGWPAFELEFVRIPVPDAGGVPLPSVALGVSERWLEAMGPGGGASMRELAAAQRAAFLDDAHPVVTDPVLERLVEDRLPLVLAPRLWRVHLEQGCADAVNEGRPR
jgi:hypothetical protein